MPKRFLHGHCGIIPLFHLNNTLLFTSRALNSTKRCVAATASAIFFYSSSKVFKKVFSPGSYIFVQNFTGAFANISIYVDDDDDDDLRLPNSQSHGRSAPRAELAAVLGTLGPSLRALADILPENASAWALHDLHEQPLATYAFGQVCMAGDAAHAAHAATSHQGAGASIDVEDVALPCKLLVRWLVWSSRRQGQLKYMAPDIGTDMSKIEEDLTERARMLLTWDMEAVIQQALRELDKSIAAMEADV
ncbi:hypothetical protein MY11210_005425 [Beauveria gryllotalpidicola]